MADTKISAAADAGALLATDMVPLARSGNSSAFHATMSEVAGFVGASPVLTGTPTAPTQAAGDNTTAIATDAFVQTAVAPAFNDIGRNYIHNALFNVQQRGTGAWTTTNTYTVDRWLTSLVNDTISVYPIALADSDRASIADEAVAYALLNTFTGSATAGSLNVMMHRIENVRRLSGKVVTVSFWAAANAVVRLGVSVDQNFGTGGSPSAAANGVGQSVALSTAWARYSFTINIPSVSGKTLGTNNNDNTQLTIWYSAEATNNSRSGSVGVQSGTVRLWGVQLEIGSVATPLAKRDPADDLALCQRFYFAGPATAIGGAAFASGAQILPQMLAFPVSMRALPTATVNASGGTNITAVAQQAVNTNYLTMVGTPGAAGAYSFTVNFTASADL